MVLIFGSARKKMQVRKFFLNNSTAAFVLLQVFCKLRFPWLCFIQRSMYMIMNNFKKCKQRKEFIALLFSLHMWCTNMSMMHLFLITNKVLFLKSKILLFLSFSRHAESLKTVSMNTFQNCGTKQGVYARFYLHLWTICVTFWHQYKLKERLIFIYAIHFSAKPYRMIRL